MDFSVIVFLVLSFGALVSAFILEGGHLLALFVGTAGIIVFGGTIGAVGLSFPMEEINVFPKYLVSYSSINLLIIINSLRSFMNLPLLLEQKASLH